MVTVVAVKISPERSHGSSKPCGAGVLDTVLDLLGSLVVEPFSKISLKYLTLKSVFLAAI